MDRGGLEHQIFSWESWDEDSNMSMIFYQAELKVPVGDFPVGHKFDTVFFNGNDSIVSFMDDRGVIYTYELNVSVGKRI